MSGQAPEVVDLLITGGAVVCMDAAATMHADGAIAIRNRRIVWIGPAHHARGKFVAPGRTRKLKNPVWKNYYIPFEAMLEPEDVYLSGLVAYTDMISVGT